MGTLLPLVLFICSVMAAPNPRFQFDMPADLQLIDQRQLGIFHYALAGHISSTNDSRASVPIKLRRKSYSGTLHFFLRGLPFHVNDTYQDASKAYLWNGIKHEQPSFFVHFTPRVFVRDPFGNEINATVIRAHEGKRPLHLSLFLPAQWAEATLMVDHFRRTYSLNNLIEAARASRVAPSPTVQVYNVIGQFHGLAKSTAVRLLRMHMDWHRSLGVAADFVYITGDYVKYMDDPSLEPYLAKDVLLPVLWDVFPRIDQVVHYDQVMVYSHALLALWRRNAYAFLTDIDELLVTPAPATLPDLLERGCLQGVHQVLIDSFGTYCEGCLQGDASGTRGKKKEQGVVPATELELWGEETLAPLTRYTTRSDTIIGLPKVLAHADYVTHVFVHSGWIQPELQGATLRVGSDRGCVWIAHLRNLLGTRETDQALMVHDSSWMWPLADLDPSLEPEEGWASVQKAASASMHTPRVEKKKAGGAVEESEEASSHSAVDWSVLDQSSEQEQEGGAIDAASGGGRHGDAEHAGVVPEEPASAAQGVKQARGSTPRAHGTAAMQDDNAAVGDAPWSAQAAGATSAEVASEDDDR